MLITAIKVGDVVRVLPSTDRRIKNLVGKIGIVVKVKNEICDVQCVNQKDTVYLLRYDEIEKVEK